MKKEESILGIVSFITGLFSLATIMTGIGPVFAAVALVFGILSVVQKKKHKVFGKIGLILSIIVLSLWFIFWGIILAVWI